MTSQIHDAHVQAFGSIASQSVLGYTLMPYVPTTIDTKPSMAAVIASGFGVSCLIAGLVITYIARKG